MAGGAIHHHSMHFPLQLFEFISTRLSFFLFPFSFFLFSFFLFSFFFFLIPFLTKMERRGRQEDSDDEGDRVFRSPKRRRRVDETASSFQPGNIIRIRLRHIMCFEDTEIHMGPRMNLILGQNGSGKSAIATGIMLGCGYEVRQVGERFKKASDVISRDAREARVDMEILDNHTERMKLQRVIPREGREQYRIDGRLVPMKEYRKKIKELSIRAGSILQFLPQEKVIEFSKNTHSGILQETQSIMNETRCKRLHDELILMFKKCQSDHGMDEITPLQEDIQRLTRELKECEKARDRMERKKELNIKVC
jgi:structural maintenance of chromosomes protein 5